MGRRLLNASLVEVGMLIDLNNPEGNHLRVVRSVEHIEVEANGCPATVVVLGTDEVPVIREGDDLLWVRD